MADIAKAWEHLQRTTVGYANLKVKPPTDKNSQWYKALVALDIIDEPAPTPTPGKFQVGSCAHADMKSGAYRPDSWSIDTLRLTGAKVCRFEVEIGASVGAIRPAVEGWHAAGVKPQLLVGFHGRIPTEAECRNLKPIAEAFGPNGSRMIDTIEFGNETSYAHQWGGDTSGNASRGGQYAQRCVVALEALAGTGVGLLVQADEALIQSSSWVDGMLNAVPGLTKRAGVSGVTCHPYDYSTYGPRKIQMMTDKLAAHGDTTSLFYFTELGVPTANGRNLDGAVPFYAPKGNLTYKEAGDELVAYINRLKTNPRVRQIMLYQDVDLKGSSSNVEHNFGAVRCPWEGGGLKGEFTEAVKRICAANP